MASKNTKRQKQQQKSSVLNVWRHIGNSAVWIVKAASVPPSPCCFTQSTFTPLHHHLLLVLLLLFVFGSGCLVTLLRPLLTPLLRRRPPRRATGLVEVRVDENFSVAPPVDHSAADPLSERHSKKTKGKVWSVWCIIIMSSWETQQVLVVTQWRTAVEETKRQILW